MGRILAVACLSLALCGLSASPGRAAGGSPSPLPTLPPTPYLQNGGGPLIPRAKVVAVFWGHQVPEETVKGIPPFLSRLSGSSYFDLLSQYGSPGQPIHHPSYAGAYFIDPPQGLKITYLGIQRELAHEIAAGVLPPATPHTVYMIYMPGQADGDTGDCGYHDTFQAGPGGAQTVRYAVLPTEPTTGVCGGGSAFSNLTASSSHELAEAILDPDGVTGWMGRGYYVNQEVADLCLGREAVLHGYTVQQLWDNTTTSCAAPEGATPLCDPQNPLNGNQPTPASAWKGAVYPPSAPAPVVDDPKAMAQAQLIANGCLRAYPTDLWWQISCAVSDSGAASTNLGFDGPALFQQTFFDLGVPASSVQVVQAGTPGGPPVNLITLLGADGRTYSYVVDVKDYTVEPHPYGPNATGVTTPGCPHPVFPFLAGPTSGVAFQWFINRLRGEYPPAPPACDLNP